MIQKIKLRNFQSLKDVTLSLGRVTIIRGSSDVGKSAIIRALNAFFNNSFNTEYAHNGNLPFGVAIQKDNRVALGRRTTKGVEYKMDSILYSKTAKKIPQDISNFLGIYPYNIDVDMNVFFQVQKQFDQPFLIAESSTTIAKIIGRISNLNIVLMAMREMFSSQLELKQEINFLSSKKKEVKDELFKFSNLENYKNQLEAAETLDRELSDLENRRLFIGNLISLGSSFNVRVANFKKDSALLNELSSLVTSLDSLSEQILSLREVETLAASIAQKEEDLRKSDFSSYNNLDALISLKEKSSSLEEVVSSLSFYTTKTSQVTHLLSLISSFSFPDLEKIESLSLVIKDSVVFNSKVAVYKEDKNSLDSLLKSFEEEYLKFSEGKIICPYSNLEMQDFCKKNLL